MLKLTKITNAITKVTGRTGLKISKHSPEILIATGLVGVVVSTVLACKGTLKLESIVDEAKDTLVRIKEEPKDAERYTEKDASKDMFITYVKTGVKVLKVYAPAITVGFISVGCILSSYNILKKRNVALVAAYKGLSSAFSKYRERVIEDAGVDKDNEYRYGVKKVEITETILDAKGKEKQVTKTIDVIGDSQYAQKFDSRSLSWSKSHDYNLMTLKSQQNFANDMLTSKGHLFLNEVYDMLGLPRTQDGAIVGWVKGVGDDYVDFKVFSSAVCLVPNKFDAYEESIMLDFNVAGIIYDLI